MSNALGTEHTSTGSAYRLTDRLTFLLYQPRQLPPKLGGASLGRTHPNPKGNVIHETTKPEKMRLKDAALAFILFGPEG